MAVDRQLRAGDVCVGCRRPYSFDDFWPRIGRSAARPHGEDHHARVNRGGERAGEFHRIHSPREAAVMREDENIRAELLTPAIQDVPQTDAVDVAGEEHGSRAVEMNPDDGGHGVARHRAEPCIARARTRERHQRPGVTHFELCPAHPDGQARIRVGRQDARDALVVRHELKSFLQVPPGPSVLGRVGVDPNAAERPPRVQEESVHSRDVIVVDVRDDDLLKVRAAESFKFGVRGVVRGVNNRAPFSVAYDGGVSMADIQDRDR